MIEKIYEEIRKIDIEKKKKVKESKKYTQVMKKYLNQLYADIFNLILYWKNKELSDNAKYIYQDRYYITYKDMKNDTSPEDIWRRVARSVTSVDTLYTTDIELLKLEERIFYGLLQSKLFLPNSPLLFNVGKNIEKKYFEKDINKITYEDYKYIYNNQNTKNTSAACFVLSIEDNLENIMNTFKDVALISGAGGGIGINFSTLRPEYAKIKSGGYSSGALSFLKTFNQLGENILEGGIRRFAGMAVFGFADFNKEKWWEKAVTFHPDIIDFIKMKHNNDGKSILSNFNISIGINNTKDFIKKLESNKDIYLTFNNMLYKDLISKDFYDAIYNTLSKEKKKDINIKIEGKINSNKLFDLIISNAWKTGDPGMVFLDKANKYNPLRDKIDIRATNPCVTKDTYISVADGRGFVKMIDLVKEGKDVPVYSVNLNTGKIEIKMMRHPRLTRKNAKIYKIELSDGTTLRVTGDHRFILSDYTEREAKDLEKGDSLLLSQKYLNKRSNLSVYWKLKIDNGNNYEYQKVYESYNNLKLIYSNNELSVIKKCEYCGKEFVVPYDKREISFCSIDCYNKYKKENKNIKPKEKVVLNHKVVSVQEDGYEDVYNGTVDDNHNFGIGVGIPENFDVKEYSKSMKKGEARIYNVIYSLQCGERPNISSSKYNMITPCNLASIDVSKFYINNTYNFKYLEIVSELVSHFLDLTIDLMMFPLDSIKKGVLLLRDNGLGLMGLHGALILNNLSYNSDEGRSFAYNIMKTLEVGATNISYKLSKIKYPFLAVNDVDQSIYTAEIWNTVWKQYEDINNNSIDYVNEIYNNLISIFKKNGYNNLRNISRTTVPPTGTVSQLTQTQEYGDVGSGVEPLFALKYKRFIINKDSKTKTYVDYTTKLLDKIVIDENFLINLKQYLLDNNTLQGISKVIEYNNKDYLMRLENIFRTSLELEYYDHLKMLEAIQYCNSSSVSKTINMKKDVTEKDVKTAFIYALKSPYIKDITIYRDGSLQTQVLNTDTEDKNKDKIMSFSLKDIQLNKQGKIIPKERPLVMEVLKKKIGIKNDKNLVFYIELGADVNNEPFEVFIRPTTSTKEYTVLFNTLGRLMSLAFRSNISIREVLTQVKKVKDWKNDYDYICNIIADTIDELISIISKKGKRRIDEIKEINIQQKKWKLTSHGYYIDDEGKPRCPICGNEVNIQEGCVTCPSCGWSACS